MRKIKKYKMDKYFKADIMPRGDIGIKTNDFDFDFEEYDVGESYDYCNETSDMDVFLESVDDTCLDEDSCEEHYDHLFDYKNRSKKEASKSKNISYHLSDDEIAGFERVKTYYNANIEATHKQKEEMINRVILLGILMVSIVLVTVYITFYNMANDAIYIEHETGAVSSVPALSVSDIHDLREQISKDTSVIVNKPIVEPAKVVPREDPKVVAPSIVNNYNFEQLNTGLTTLGYSLLGCLAAFMSFKGLLFWGRSRRLKKEIKKSNALITQFKTLINSNNNQLETSQLISEQIILNNIFIERLSSNNNVVELIAVNEKLKDTNSFINDHLIKNLKGE